MAAVKARCAEEVTGIDARYESLALREFHGPQFQTLSQVWRSADKSELLARLRLPEHTKRYHMHPALLDGVIQLAGFVDDGDFKAFVPAGIERVDMQESFGRSGGKEKCLWAYARVSEASAKTRVLDFTIFGQSGAAMAMRGFRFAQLPPQPPASGLYEVRWPELSLESSREDVNLGRVSVLEVSSKSGLKLAETLSSGGLVCNVTSLDDLADVDTLVIPVEGSEDQTKLLSMLMRLLELLQSVLKSGAEMKLSRLAIVTCRCDGPVVDGDVSCTGGGAVWGLMRTARTELPARVTVLCIDTDAGMLTKSGDAAALVSQLSSELAVSDGHTEVAYRGGVRHCRKLKPSTHHVIGPVALRLENRGKLQNMLEKMKYQFVGVQLGI